MLITRVSPTLIVALSSGLLVVGVISTEVLTGGSTGVGSSGSGTYVPSSLYS